jgi:hypothetical protein
VLSIPDIAKTYSGGVSAALRTSDSRSSAYLCVITNTPSQFIDGSSNKYSWQRFQ